MSAQALATALGPPLMLHSSGTSAVEEVDHAQPIAVLKYLLQIWPQPQTAGVSGNVITIKVNRVLISLSYDIFGLVPDLCEIVVEKTLINK